MANPNTQTVPPDVVENVSRPVVWTMAFAQFGLFVALLAPVTVSLAVKTQTLVSGPAAATVNGNVLAVAAFVAMIANPVFGRLSDLTTSRWGRRRPWMVGGGLVFVIALAMVAIAPTVPALLAGWCLAQLAGNAILAPLLATIADQVPEHRRGGVSANVGVMQNIGILVAAYTASLFVHNMVLLFVLPAGFALATVVLYAFVLPDKVISEWPVISGWLAFAKTFWVNPIRYPDFGYAWISRFLLTLAAFMFISYRVFYLENQIGLTAEDAVKALATGVLIYTIALVLDGEIRRLAVRPYWPAKAFRDRLDAGFRGRTGRPRAHPLAWLVLRCGGHHGPRVRDLRRRRHRAGDRRVAEQARCGQGSSVLRPRFATFSGAQTATESTGESPTYTPV
nr:MFS transporter [Fodinicola feengrottensis]